MEKVLVIVVGAVKLAVLFVEWMANFELCKLWEHLAKIFATIC